MALFGVVFALGSGQALAQTVEGAWYNVTGTGVSQVTVKMSADVQASGAGDLFGDFELGTTDGTAGGPNTTASDEFTVTFGTNTITGTPTLTYTPSTTAGDPVIEDSGGRDLGAFTVTVMPAVPQMPLLANRQVQMGVEVSITLDEAMGGVGDITYSIPAFTEGTADQHDDGELPAGLEFDADERMITGEATTLGRYLVTYTATDDAAAELTAAGSNHVGNVNFYIEVGSAAPPTVATPGRITKIVVDGAVEKTIDGDKRMHVTEGDLTKVTVTIEWTHEQLRALWAAGTPADVAVMFEMMSAPGTGSAASWLSGAENEDGHDDVTIGTAAMVEVPKIPATRSATSRGTDTGTGSTTLHFGRDPDAEEEGFYLMVTNIDDFEARSEDRTDPHVIEDINPQDIVLKRDGSGVIYEGGPQVKFDVTASPARVELPLNVRFDLMDVTGQTVASRDNVIDKANGTIPTGTGSAAKDTVTLTLDKNDGNRTDDMLALYAEVVVYALDSGNFDDNIGKKKVDIEVVDLHKLPPTTVSPMTTEVEEGGMVTLTYTVNRNPPDTTVLAGEEREYTDEALTITLSPMGDAMSNDFRIADMTLDVPKHSGKASDGWMQEVKVEVEAMSDEELEGMETLMLEATVAGTDAANGSGTRMDAEAMATVTITDGTMTLVWPKSDEEIQEVVYAAKEAGAGADMIFSPGEMIEIMTASALFNSAEGVTLSYSAMSDHDHVATVSVSGSAVTVTAGHEVGMAHITITAHASMPSGAKGLPQTDPREASIIFPVEVGLEALSITLMGPEDMNLVEGGMGGMVTATANRAVTEDVTINLMRDRAMSSADDMDYTAEAITIAAGMMSGTTMVMATADDMMENEGNMPEELVIYGMAADNAGEVMGEVKFYIWDAAVPALPIIAQLLLAAFLALGGYRRYRRR